MNQHDVKYWLLSTGEQFERLRQLQPNWDSYGAGPLDPRCIEGAARMLADLKNAGWHGPWSVVPCSNGGVQLEQHCYGIDIEITIDKHTHTEPTDRGCV